MYTVHFEFPNSLSSISQNTSHGFRNIFFQLFLAGHVYTRNAKHNLILPKPRTIVAKNAFKFSAARRWNEVPKDIKEAQSIRTFLLKLNVPFVTIISVNIVCKYDFLELCIFNFYVIYFFIFWMFNFLLRAMYVYNLWISSETALKKSIYPRLYISRVGG